MLILHDSAISGNAYKVRLLLGHLGLAYRRIEYDVDDGSTRRPEFLAKNPNGKVPVLELPDGRCLAESNAILCYLARGSRFRPQDPWAEAEVLSWLFFEQYSHEPYIAVVRHWLAHLGKTVATEPQLPSRIAGGRRALSLMEAHLGNSPYFVGEVLTIADIALYAYTHVAEEGGGFDLAAYPRIKKWLDRVAAEPGHSRITD